MMGLIYKTKTASRKQVLSHLQECDANFSPPLSQRVDLADYANRLSEKSVSFEAWDGSILVGMLNAYLNNVDNRTGFITNVSVLKEYARRRVGSTLLQMCLEYASQRNFSCIRLAVSRENGPALGLYSGIGFKVIAEEGNKLLLEHNIESTSQRKA